MRFSICAVILVTACAIPAIGQTNSAVAPGDVSVGSPIALTFYVALDHPKAAEAKAKSIQTPGSADYHKFLSVPEFVSKYAATDAELSDIEASLVNLGFTIGEVYPNHLAIEVLGTVGVTQAALGVQMKHFVVNGRSGMASVKPVTLPPQLQGKIQSVGGLNTITHAHPNHLVSPFASERTSHPVPSQLTGGTRGNWLPIDFEKHYDVTPIYQYGFKGHGSTIGIVTLNDFKVSDAYSFWQAIGLNVSQTRVTKVNVDGGETAAGNNPDGESETDLDTEYAGAIAPDAKIRVYIAPASDANFINAFEAAASENLADTVSTSWGDPELFYFYDVATQTPADTSLLVDFHDVFLEMALQGQTIYVASGDSGAFDTVEDCPAFGTPSPATPVCNAPYAVDSPSTDPLVTAAGGTTLPLSFTGHSGTHYSVDQEQAWSWSYIVTEAAEQGDASEVPLSTWFSGGDGGGVSSFWDRPWYQSGVSGINNTEPGQYFSADFGSGSVVQVVLPGNFAGRNLPDIATDADPETGYQFVEEGYVYDFYGGTSFVAPQLNGVTALFVQAVGRVGQINPALYELGSYVSKDLKAGDNWGYSAVKGYDDASGVGTLDAAYLLEGLYYLKTY
jgi:subtilase family serine protease